MASHQYPQSWGGKEGNGVIRRLAGSDTSGMLSGFRRASTALAVLCWTAGLMRGTLSGFLRQGGDRTATESY
jgi:hypothetical protein